MLTFLFCFFFKNVSSCKTCANLLLMLFSTCAVEANMKTVCCMRLTIGLTYRGHLILSLLKIYPLLNSRMAYAFFHLPYVGSIYSCWFVAL